MKIAFANADCPAQSFETAAKLANQCGYDAVELSSSDALLSPPNTIRQIFAGASLGISAIHVGADLGALSMGINLAADLGGNFIRIAGDAVFTPSYAVAPATIDLLLATADIAANSGVGVLIDNQPIPGSALRLWNLLDRLNHPGIGCSWNTLSAAFAGDAPAVAIPMLNTRIRYLHFQDAKLHDGPITRCDLGQGDLPLRNTANRLRGIGFDGCLLVGLAQKPDQEESRQELSLQAARSKLQQWQILPTPVSGK